MVLGTFIDVPIGMLLKITEGTGVVYLRLMLAFTGNVVLRSHKDHDQVE